MLRLAFLRGAELQSQLDHGRPQSNDELRRILLHYPGDLTAENGLVPIVGSAALFHGKPVVIDYSRGIRDPRIIDAQLHGLIKRLEYAGVSEDELLFCIHERVVEHVGVVARLVSRTDHAIEFSVTRH